jgi:hypothetical protein
MTESTNWGVGEVQYRVPKLPTPVTVVLEGGEQIAGDLYLLPEAGRHGGRERVVDLLTAAEPFLPLITKQGPMMVSKTRIVLLRMADQADLGWDADLEGFPRVDAEIEMAGVGDGDRHLRASLRLAMPPGQQRLLDYLNAAPPFFPVLLIDGPALIHREYVQRLCPV